MRPLAILGLIFLVGLCAAVPVRAQALPSFEEGLPLVVAYDKDDFGGHPQVWDMVQDERGVLYFANREGVILFDGAHWQTIPLQRRTTARALALAQDGTLWVGAEGDLGYLEPDAVGSYRFVSLWDQLPPSVREQVESMAQPKLFARPDGLVVTWGAFQARWDGERFHVTEGAIHSATEIGGRLIATEPGRGLVDWSDGRRTLLPGTELLAQDGRANYIVDRGDGTWLVVATRGLAVYDGSTLRPLRSPLPALFAATPALHVAALGTDRYAVATDGAGVLFIDGEGRLVQRLDTSTGLPDDAVYHLDLDRDGGLWLSHETGIVYTGFGAPTSMFDGRLGLPGTLDSVTRHEGALYATTNLGLYRLRPGDGLRPASFEPVRFPVAQGDYRGLLSTPAGLLVATSSGVWEVNGLNARSLPGPALEIRSYVLLQTTADSNAVIVGLQDGLGLLRLQNGRWRNEGRLPDILRTIRFLGQEDDGTIWAGTFAAETYRLDTRNGVSLDMPVRELGTNDGFSPEGNSPLNTRRGFLFGSMEFTRRFDPSTNQFLQSNGYGRRSGEHGVVRFAEVPGSDMAVIFGPLAGPTFTEGTEVGVAFPEGDSLRWRRGLLRPFPPLYAWALYPESAPDGYAVWMGCTGGLVRYHGPLPHAEAPPFQALVTNTVLDADSLVFGGLAQDGLNTRFGPDARNFRFRFAAPRFANPDGLRYRVQLVGLDEDWSAWTAEAQKDYTNLAPGTYTFRVQAKDAHEAISEAGLYAFTIAPPWYGTWWARLIGLVLFIGLIGYLAREGPTLVQRALAKLPRKRLVSHYRLDKKIGQGGAGEVWQAADLTASRTGGSRLVAVKLLHEHLLDDGSGSGTESDGRQRLRREADALAAFDHPHIVQVYEGGVWNDTPYLAMELLPGTTLRARIRERGPLPADEAAALGVLLADALSAIHARGIIHRDIKSDNVMLADWPSTEAAKASILGRSRTGSSSAPDGDGAVTAIPDDPVLRAATAHLPYRPVLMDFGLARGGTLSTLTQLGALLGTLGYMAPEQAMGLRSPDAQSDLFSFGVVLYEALTGRLPFRADNEIALLHALFNHQPEPPSDLMPGTPEGLSYLVMRCLSKEPADRPVSAEAVVRALGAMGVAM